MAGKQWDRPNSHGRPRRSCENGHFQMDESEIACSRCHKEFRNHPRNLTEVERDFYRAALLRCTSHELIPPTIPPVDEPELLLEPEIDPEDEFIRESGFTIILGPDDVCVDPNFRLTGPWVDSRGNPPPQRTVSRIPVIRLSREELLALPPIQPTGQSRQEPQPEPGPSRPGPNLEAPVPRPNTPIGQDNDSWQTYATGSGHNFVNSSNRNPFIMEEPVFYATGWYAGRYPPRGRNQNGLEQIRPQHPGPSEHRLTTGQNQGQSRRPTRNPLWGIHLPPRPGPPIALVRGPAPIGQQSSPQLLPPDIAPGGVQRGGVYFSQARGSTYIRRQLSRNSGSENWSQNRSGETSTPRGSWRGRGTGRVRGRLRSRGTGLERGNP